MGKRRMFSKDIVRSDAFLDLPISSQALYFQLGMDTDDRGYIPNAKSLIRMLGANQGDLEPLINKGFILIRDNSLLLQKHFRINNYIQKDRFRETTYLEDLKTLFLEENGAYTTQKEKGIAMNFSKKDTECVQDVYDDVYKTDTQDKLSKDKLSKVKISEDKISKVNNDRIDKNKIDDNFVENDFTKRLIKNGYIESDDLELAKYNDLYKMLKIHYTNKEIAVVLHYVIYWTQYSDIKNKYAYLEKSMIVNLAKVKRIEENIEKYGMDINPDELLEKLKNGLKNDGYEFIE